ncbi:MAG: hypothetical protein JSV56_05030 [Methanomassiliicoccales archaeon]|nr:MAG: hypothetical protein JSV56_05030 [Methanomassiliicoccales archaeon]
MLGKLVGLGIIVFLCSFSGCIDTPPSPLSSIPRILIDHIIETEETKVYVHGLDDHMFSNITIEINNATITENYTYSLHLTTKLLEVSLNVSVWDKQKEYEYNGNMTLLSEQDQIMLEVDDERRDDPIERSLPYNIIMERKE